VIFKSRDRFFGFSGFGHLFQRLQDFLFGEIHVFEAVLEKVFKLLFLLLRHGTRPLSGFERGDTTFHNRND
jgi:hypothetical protein